MSFDFNTFGTTTQKKTSGSFDFDSFGTDAGPIESISSQAGPRISQGENLFNLDVNSGTNPASIWSKSMANIPSAYIRYGAGGIADIPKIIPAGEELLAQNDGSIAKATYAWAKSALQDIPVLAEKGFNGWKKMGEGIYSKLESDVLSEDSLWKGVTRSITEMVLNDPLLIPSLLFAPKKIAGKGDTISELAKPVTSRIEAGLEKRAIASDANKIKRVELQNKDLRTAMDFSDDANAGARDRITRSNVLEGAVNEDGVITTLGKNGPLERYKALTIGDNEGVVRDMLKVEYKSDPSITISPSEMKRILTSEVKTSGLEGKALTQALRNVTKELEGLKLRVDQSGNIPLYHIQNAKISTYQGINYLTEPHVKTYSKAVGRAYKKAVERTSKLNVGEVNAVLEQFYKDADLLEGLNGKRVPGGKLGVFTSQVAGSATGAIVGALVGGIPGSVVGSAVGPSVGKALKQRSLKRYFNGKERPMQKNPVLEKARGYVNQSSKENQVNKKQNKTTAVRDISKTIPQNKVIINNPVDSRGISAEKIAKSYRHCLTIAEHWAKENGYKIQKGIYINDAKNRVDAVNRAVEFYKKNPMSTKRLGKNTHAWNTDSMGNVLDFSGSNVSGSFGSVRDDFRYVTEKEILKENSN